MKKILILLSLSYMFIFLSGCVTIKENQYNINQLKSRMMNVENALARHNLIIQQNKSEIDGLYDKIDEVEYEDKIVTTDIQQVTKPRQVVMPKILKIDNSKTTILSNKLKVKPAIIDVQRALRNAGFYLGNLDGKAGPLTKVAIKRFQKSNNLTSDGIIGNQTWKKLKRYL